MKSLLIAIFCLLAYTASAQSTGTIDSTKKVLDVKASCGKCKLGLTGKTCELAVRINGKSYYVDGAAIDSFGDAHDDDGFCNSVRKARVQGEVVNGRFVATYFEVLPPAKKKK